MSPAERRLAEAVDLDVHLELVARMTVHIVDPTQRAMIDLYVEHLRAELIDCDIDALMATMSDDPSYSFYGWDGEPPMSRRGIDEVRKMYLRSYEGGANQAAMNHIDRIVISDEMFLLEGVNSSSGARLRSLFPAVEAFIEPRRVCVVRKRQITMFPFRDGRFTGERVYFDGFFRPREVEYFD